MSENSYDVSDMVRREAVMAVGGTHEGTGYRHNIKMAAYRVRDPVTGDFSPLQFHMTMDNIVFAVMPENAATMFASFVSDTVANTAGR